MKAETSIVGSQFLEFFIFCCCVLVVVSLGSAVEDRCRYIEYHDRGRASKKRVQLDLVETRVGVDLGLDGEDGVEQLVEDSLTVLGECSLNLDALLLRLNLHTVRCLIR